MVEYGLLWPVLIKVSWMKHNVQGQSMIWKDRHMFWMCKLNEREDLAIENPYVFSIHVSQVFFMADSRDPIWSVVLSNEPCSRRIIGEKKQVIFAAKGAPISSNGMLPGDDAEPSQVGIESQVPEVEIPKGGGY